MTNFEELVLALRELREKRLHSKEPGQAGQNTSLEERELAAYIRGREDCAQEMRRQLTRRQEEFHALEKGVLESLRRALPQVAREWESRLKELCLELARKLVADLPITVGLVERVVQEALSQIEQADEYHVYLHPDDLDLLRSSGSDLVAAGRPWRCHAAPEVSRGGCIVKTVLGMVDAQRESKFELLKKALHK